VRERIEYRFRVSSATVFTLYSYSKALEYRFRVPTAGNLSPVRSEDGDGAAPLRRLQRAVVVCGSGTFAVVVVVCSVRIIHDPSEK
jgi:hypothetical protein